MRARRSPSCLMADWRSPSESPASRKLSDGLLSFGPEAVVLEPPKLRELIRKDLHESLIQYPVSRMAVDLVRESRAI
jgi:hypothetical protein